MCAKTTSEPRYEEILAHYTAGKPKLDDKKTLGWDFVCAEVGFDVIWQQFNYTQTHGSHGSPQKMVVGLSKLGSESPGFGFLHFQVNQLSFFWGEVIRRES